MDQAKKWLDNCKTHHGLCRTARGTDRRLPTRLLFVGDPNSTKPGEQAEVRLVTSDGNDPDTKFLALSHCWGGDIPFKLVKDNIDDYFRGVEMSRLPKNMQDAVTITRRLGFAYIWIDSLCIIQDSPEDWAREALTMGSVYTNAACTIASTGSQSSAGGCFHERSTKSLKPCKIGASSPDALLPRWIYARRDDVFDFERSVDRSPLNSRAWVQQERLLSRRILHFGAEMIYWECSRRSASELNPNGYVYKRYPDDFKDNYVPDLSSHISTRADVERAERENSGFSWAGAEAMRLRPPPVDLDPDTEQTAGEAAWQRHRGFWREVRKASDRTWANPSLQPDFSGFRGAFERLSRGRVGGDAVGAASFSHMWYEIVESFTRCSLTFTKDKLIALHGLVGEIERASGYTYLSGLWGEHLVTDLLWFAAEGPGVRLLDSGATQLPAKRAPTWSWASINGVVMLDLVPETSLDEFNVRERLITFNEPGPPTSTDTGAGGPEERERPHESMLYLEAPLLPVIRLRQEGTEWYVDIDKRSRSAARFYPDVEESTSDSAALFCLPVLVLEREVAVFLTARFEEEIQGLVVKQRGGGSGPETYERVGFFTTSRVKGNKRARNLLKKACVKCISLA